MSKLTTSATATAIPQLAAIQSHRLRK